MVGKMAKSPTRAFVLPIKGREADIEKLRQLVEQAGCEPVCDQALPADYEKCLENADVLVVLICPQTMDDSAVNQLIVHASRTGKRVVGVWALNLKDSVLPTAINKHGDAVIVFDVAAIRQSVCGDQSSWSTPDGKPRPTPKTPRHKG